MGGKASRNKGGAFERECTNRIKAELGIECLRVPLSGAAAGFKGDLHMAGLVIECKRRKRNFTSLYQALEQGGGSDFLLVRDDQRETLAVMTWETFASFCRWAGLPERFPAAHNFEPKGNEDV